MRPRTWLTAVALTAIVAAPLGAEGAQQRRRTQDNRDQPRQAEQAPEQTPERSTGRERAVTRTAAPRAEQPPRQETQNRGDDQNRRVEQNSRVEQNNRGQENNRGQQSRGYDQNRRVEQERRPVETRRYDNGRYDNGRYDNRRYDNGRRYYAPRIIRPTIIRVSPYRPYVYRPSYRIGIYYGADGYYPYGVTPRGYYEPIPGRYYGGVRITGVPRDAEVFADGYYVGLVNDFDGIFQHVNLEAGSHHIEIEWGGAEPIAFDVYVRPGETTTFRGDGYFRE
jgi:hypothetical protein